MSKNAELLHGALAIARRQRGVITWDQLMAAGVTRAILYARLADGTLRRLHRGVYAVGLFLPPGGAELAACLACGPDAWLGRESAAVQWGVMKATSSSRIHVMLRTGCARPPGLVVHRVRTLRRDEVTRKDGLPLTTPARTLLDLAGVLRPRVLEQLFAELLVQRLTTEAAVKGVLRRQPRMRGVRRLWLLMGGGEPALTRSEAEERLLALIREAKLAAPVLNRKVAGFEVDFYWPAARLVVEVDGFPYHSGRHAFERDRRKASALAKAGLRVMQFTWRRIVAEPLVLVAEITEALVRSA